MNTTTSTPDSFLDLIVRTTKTMALVAVMAAFAGPAAAQGQSADLEYYMQPSPSGGSMVSASPGGLSVQAELGGVALTFNTGGAFAREFVAQSQVDVSSTIEVTVPDFADGVPDAAAQLPIADGRFELRADGETIEGDVSAQSHVTIVPYAPAPRVLFYELTLIPASTTVTPSSGVQFSMDEIKAWGILITDGVSFNGGWGIGQSQQYAGSAEF
jgi:hypothetical protein